ncbi:multiple sugar transport system ATP-binding protein [Ardenticatena maritima]|uniref:Glycerol-3-phosphate ABC transporter ATP-binding protein n=1 Tax=Ardenticatena maritima TaxID=872965 RepID=A0A0M8K908_9CHLR|nr:ABC transporter ATP-binding protein [Ardenticatena maritima]KPL87693.1 glycerol-3-phosphate ABC transporter ATP-binding protein [Ardenticatena maritima]GAP62756.1 multiple sugar transport system ATP-binding protein [Ardenticatena maritima]
MASVTYEHVWKAFGDNVVIKDLHLEVKDKEFLVLVGPSGCGKSTALRMLAGLEEVTEGNIWIGDRIVNDVPPKDRNIAMVFQSYALYPHMSVYDNMAFGLKLRKMPKDEIDRRVKEAAQILGIDHLLDRKPKALSGGQRQRVALGRAIVREPAVFLMDEPLSNLDAKLRVQTRAELIRLHKRLQTTFIYVTHDQVEAMTMADRIAVMRDGVLQQLDTPQNLYNHPQNVFVAGFIGSPAMNFFNATLTGTKEEMYVDTGGFRLRLPEHIAREVSDWLGKEVILGIRPEHLFHKAFAMPGINPQPIKAKLDVKELLGNEELLYLDANGQQFVARVDARVDVVAGETVELVVDVDQIKLFNPADEQAIYS